MSTIYPPVIVHQDSPRTRKTDPATSHAAADRSQFTRQDSRLAVLRIVATAGPLAGSEINDLYHLATARNIAPQVAWDSPRKRAGELLDDGYLIVSGERPTRGNHSVERVFDITDAGIAELAKAAV